MQKVRDKRKKLGGPFRLDYVDIQGRSGSELATLAGKAGGRARSNKASKQEKIRWQERKTEAARQQQQINNGTGSTSIEGSDILEAAFLEVVVSLQIML